MSTSTLLLLDGTALAYRAYFAFIRSNLKNTDGLSTGAIYGFANTIDRLIETHRPTHIAVAWDTSAPTFRHEMDPDYKANRPPQPEELRDSIPYMKELLAHFRIPSLQRDGIEADDIVGSLAESARGQDVTVYMVTPDKDYMQLVHDNIFMMKPLNNGDGFQIIDRAGVEEFFGVPPEMVVDVLAVIGDSSDNIPGIQGIGKKTAPELIREFGSIEALIKAASTHKSKKVREGVEGNEDRIRLSREMIVIKTDVTDFTNWKTLKWEGPDRQSLSDFFHRMQFRTLTKKYSSSAVSARSVGDRSDSAQSDLFAMSVESEQVSEGGYMQLDKKSVKYELVDTIGKLETLAVVLKNSEVICIDTETTGTDAVSAELLGISVSVEPTKAWYIDVDRGGLSIENVRNVLSETLTDDHRLIVGHNIKYDYMILTRYGFNVGARLFDTMLAAYLLDPSQQLKMDTLSMKYLNYMPIPIEELIGTGRNQRSMRDVDINVLVDYACEDADITYQLYLKLKDELDQDDLNIVAETIEFPLSRVLGNMELAGIRIDISMLESFSKQITEDILSIEKEIFEEAGMDFNINSPQQLGEVLFKKLKLPSGKKTATGKYSTSESVLSDLAIRYSLPGKILDYRSLAKLRSTYIDALPPLVNPETGRIHTSFNQSVAATGRLSSSNPNLQNIPIRTDRGREIRKAFVPAEDFKLLSADYSQVELRVIASISGDEAMIAAFRNDEDIHARTAKEIFGLHDISHVDREYRRKAKEVNFGIPYGVSAFGLAQRLGIGNNEGKEIIDAYFRRFPGIKTYIDSTIVFAREHGFVKTLSGRRRYIPDINSSNFNVRAFAERTAINMPIQGTAADLIKLAMIRLDKELNSRGLHTRMLLQVHDELVFEVHETEVDEMMQLVKECMEQAMQLRVPLKVEMGVADNWLDAH